MNNWSTTVDLQSAIDLLLSCSNNGDFGYVFVYALSALQSALNKCAAIVTVKELTRVKQTLINLLNSGKLNGFNIIKGTVFLRQMSISFNNKISSRKPICNYF